MSKKCIAMIYEGEKTEAQLIENLKQIFFNDLELVPIVFPAGENLYMLWNQLKEDDFQTDVVEVLREYNKKAREVLTGYSRTDFMEIYLFFDYDGHTNNLPSGMDPQEVLGQMLDTFQDETDLGKLYVNYPMVESIRDNLPSEKEWCYRRCWVSMPESGGYKHTVHEIKDYQDFRKLTPEDWGSLCVNSLKKLHCIIASHYELPQRDYFLRELTQKALFEKQSEKFVRIGKIAVINSFPLFLLEYFKEGFWNQMLKVQGI